MFKHNQVFNLLEHTGKYLTAVNILYLQHEEISDYWCIMLHLFELWQKSNYFTYS